jgi:hypothetical protein
MRRLLIIFALLLTVPAFAAPAFVQGVFGGNTTTSLAYSGNNTAHNTLLAFMESSNGGSLAWTTLTDTRGNKWEQVAVAPSSSSWFVYIYMVRDCAAGANTVTTNGFSGFQRMAIAEYSGLDNVNPIRSAWGNGFANSGGTLTTQALTAVVGDLVVGWGFSLGGSMAAGTGYTARATNDGFAMFEDKIAASTSETPTMTNSSNSWSMVGVVLSPTQVTDPTGAVRWNLVSSGSTTSQTITLPANTSGNTMALGVHLSAALSPSVSDSAGNTWKLGYNNIASSTTVAIFYAENIATSAGTNTITVTWGGSTRGVDLIIAEYPNVVTTGKALRFFSCGTNCTTDSNSLPQTGAMRIPTASNDLVVAVSLIPTGMIYGPPTGYTQRTANASQFLFSMYDNLGSANQTVPGTVPAVTNSGEKDTIVSIKRTGSGASNLVQGGICNNSASVACAFPYAYSSTSNEVVLAVASEGTNAPTLGQLTDTLTTTYTLTAAGACTLCTQTRRSAFYHAPVPSTSANTVTWNPASGGYTYIAIMEFSSTPDTVSVSAACLGPGACTPPTPGAVAVPAAGTLFCVINGDAISTITPSDVAVTVPATGVSWKAVSAGAGQTCTGNNGSVASLMVLGSSSSGYVRHRITNQ